MSVLALSQVLLCAVVLGAGHLIGEFRVKGASLGVAAVFFVGLGVSAVDPRLRLPDFVDQFGLALFVYMVGLAGGPTFFRTLRRRGLRDNVFVVAMVLVAAAATVVAGRFFHLSRATTAGVFAGATVNVPALGGSQDALHNLDPVHADALSAQAAVGMSLSYGFGVIAMIAVLVVYLSLTRIDFDGEAKANTDLASFGQDLVERAVTITHGAGADVEALSARDDAVLLSRLVRNGHAHVAVTLPTLMAGDTVSLVGTAEAVAALAAELGEPFDGTLSAERGEVDFRRMTVSNHALAGSTVAELRLPVLHGAMVSRVRRGDQDLLATQATALELGDRVRVVAPHENMAAVASLLGDSDKALSKVDFTGITVGLALGLLLGLLPIPLPRGITLRLGVAGGPIIAGLVFGFIGRTRGITWQQPHQTVLVLRQVGVMLFFAGIGLKSGAALTEQLGDSGAWSIVGAGAAVSTVVALTSIFVGRYLLRAPMSWLMGLMAGMGTNPAVLTFAEDRSKNELPVMAYSTVFPIAMVSKIIIGELLIQLFIH
jgi:putative transport protein